MRPAGVSDLEDHIAAVLEARALLVQQGDEAAEQAFFQCFLWLRAKAFAAALRGAAGAHCYRAVADLLETFLATEAFCWEVEA